MPKFLNMAMLNPMDILRVGSMALIGYVALSMLTYHYRRVKGTSSDAASAA